MLTNISQKMFLGTAQFGMDYGITNIDGKPSKQEVLEILDKAWENKIQGFDTAPGYCSESLLGEFIQINGLHDQVKVLTKIPSLDGVIDYREFIIKSLESSLNHISCPIDVLFFHNPKDVRLLLYDEQFFTDIIKNYPVSCLGASVYNPNDISKLSECSLSIALQFPYNCLDTRFKNININNAPTFARSIFLQGLLATNKINIEKIPFGLNEVHKKIHKFFITNNENLFDYAFNFVANSNEIDFFIVGVNSLIQLNQILSIRYKENSFEEELKELLTDKDRSFLDPRKWTT